MNSKHDNYRGVTEDAVRKALSTVIEPELHRDLVSLNMVRDISISDADLTFTIVLTTPACPLKGKMEADARSALAQIAGIGRVEIKWDSEVPQDRRIMQQIGQQFKNTVAVSSGKGGVGKTTLAVNIAISLAKSGAKIGLLDADILGPNVPMMMGVDQMPPPRNRKMVPAEKHGVKFISMAFLTRPDQPLVWRGPMLHSAIRQLLTDVEWGELDYLIVDLPPGTGDAQLSLAQNIPLSGAIIVTQPMGAGARLAAEQGVDLLGTVPLDAQVRIGGDNGDPIVVVAPESPAAAALNEIASVVAGRISVLTLANQDTMIPIQVIN
jgi:ATP-binding protein involved in chromosome partitioning